MKLKMKKRAIYIISIEIIALLLLYVFIKLEYQKWIPSCWIYKTTGILCPACGGTRCVVFMLQGKWIQAFFSHIIFFIGILYALVLNAVVIININKEKKVAIWLYPKWWYVILFCVILLVYTIIRNLL